MMSSRPCRRTVSPTRRSMSAQRATSAARWKASPPARRMSSSVGSPPSTGVSRRSASATRAPSAAKRRAMARPMPELAPVTMAERPSSSPISAPPIRRRVMIDPVARDLLAPADPDPVPRPHMLEEPDQAADPARPADQPAVQAHRHHLGCALAFAPEGLEGVPEIIEEEIAGGEVLVARHAAVVVVEGMRDDEMGLAADRCPEGQVIGIGVAVVKEAALLGHQPARVQARPARVTAPRAAAPPERDDVDRA